MKFIVPQKAVTHDAPSAAITKWRSLVFDTLIPTLWAVISPHSKAFRFIELKSEYSKTQSNIIAMNIKLVYETPCTLPKVQNTTSATWELSAKYSIKATKPPKKIDMAIPQRMMLVALNFLNFEIKKIINVGIRANMNAKSTTEIEVPNKLAPKTIAIQAPHEAPCETPIVEGAANGLPNELCKTQPHTPSMLPANSEHKT